MSHTKTVKPKGKAKILLVDDHAVVRFGLQQLIHRQPDLEICGEAADGARALGAIATLKPNLILVDLTLKDSSGLELMRNIKVQHPKLPMLVLSIHDESIYAEISFRAGAMGYLMKGEAVDKILTAIRQVLAGKVYVSEPMAAKILQKQLRGHTVTTTSSVADLSDRELEVFQMIGYWKVTRQIADVLHLSTKTIEYYRDQIKSKLGFDNAVELTHAATTWAQTEMVPSKSSKQSLAA